MATTCKSCGRPVKIDPASQKVTCDFCGNKFIPEDIEEYAKDVLEKIEPSKMTDQYMDSYVYCCSSCGGQIIVNGTESSTACIYCGSPSIVFNRIIKQKRPEYIIPFKITRKEALDSIKSEFKKGPFVPHAIKRFKEENIRGIYIPYWVFNADHYGAIAAEGTISEDNSSKTVYFARSGLMNLKNLPIDASSVLSNESSERLEPFNMTEMKPFNESYLLGFYSDISDVEYNAVTDLVRKRAKTIFEDYATGDIRSDSMPKIISSFHETEIYESDIRYAMFPAWFISYRYKGKNNTVLVNGQTGKVICGIPWNGKLVMALYLIACILLTVLSFYFARFVLVETELESIKENDYRYLFAAIGCIIGGSIITFRIGFVRLKQLFKSIDLTQRSSLFDFMRRRQGDL